MAGRYTDFSSDRPPQTRGSFWCAERDEDMTQEEIKFVRDCIGTDIHQFYASGKWKRLRADVLRMDKWECQICRGRGKYTKATTVHHVNYVKTHPELALEMWYAWRGERKRNLISLCHDCHEEVHGYRKRERQRPLTEERWD